MISIAATKQKLQRFTPFLISLGIHGLLLLLFASVIWHTPRTSLPEDQAARILLQGQQDMHLQFQGKDKSDRYKVKDHMVYPLPEIDYNPVLPDLQYYPEPKLREEIDLIGIEHLSRTNQHKKTGRQPLYTGDEKLAGSFTRHIKLLREGGLDVVFVFDSTSSMAEFLQQVKYKITNLTATFKELVPTVRIGMVTYRDRGSAFITRAHRLTYGTKSLQQFLNEIEPGEGGDREEAVDEALRVAVEEMKWRPKAKKIILLIGDAPPHEQNIDKTLKLIELFRNSMHGAVATLDTRRQIFIPISSSEAHQQQGIVMESFKRFADCGGGESARLLNEDKVIRQMVIMVFGTRWEMFLDEFLKNL